jgi:ATP-binding cassette subfamily F protein 3
MTSSLAPGVVAPTTLVQAQLQSLQDADTYATAWATAWATALAGADNALSLSWGGRGQGGRGRARRTWQPRTIVVEPLHVSYVGSQLAASQTLLEDAVLKVHPAHVYAMVGRNGTGKTSLLQQMQYKTLTGFSPHVTTFCVAQRQEGAPKAQTVAGYLRATHAAFLRQSHQAQQHAVEELQVALEALDVDTTAGMEQMQVLSDQLAALDDDDEQSETDLLDKDWQQAVDFMGVDTNSDTSMVPLGQQCMTALSPGQRQKVRLAAALLCPCQLLLLDEPSLALDIPGLLCLRRLIDACQTERQSSVMLVSHDIDLINDVATDIIEWRRKKLFYYSGNYENYQVQRQQGTVQHERQAATASRKLAAAEGTLQHLKAQKPSQRKSVGKKKGRQLNAQRQKMGRIAADEQHAKAQLVDEGLLNDKEIQFVFSNPKSQWQEALILAHAVGHGYGDVESAEASPHEPVVLAGNTEFVPWKQQGFLFDLVDLCIEEGGTYAIVGPSASGKTTLLRILAGLLAPAEGEVKYALNVDVAYVQDNLPSTKDDTLDALTYLRRRFPQKTEQEIRGELSSFGLGATQATTRLAFLSGGERARLNLAAVLLAEPDVLLWDTPTADLDPTSVEALITGLRAWKGTTVLVSHDTNLLRELEAQCWAMVPEQGKLRRVQGGIDEYVRSFAQKL